MRAVVPVVVLSVLVGGVLAAENYDPGPPAFLEQDDTRLLINPAQDNTVPHMSDRRTYQIWNDGFKTSIKLLGMYNGTDFYMPDHTVDGEQKMRIGPSITSGDGVVDVFMVPRIQGTMLNATFYFDQEFLDRVGSPDLLSWDKQTGEKTVQRLTYEQVGDGIYRARYQEDIARTHADSDYVPAFIYIGDVRKEGFVNIPPNGTAMYLS